MSVENAVTTAELPRPGDRVQVTFTATVTCADPRTGKVIVLRDDGTDLLTTAGRSHYLGRYPAADDLSIEVVSPALKPHAVYKNAMGCLFYHHDGEWFRLGFGLTEDGVRPMSVPPLGTLYELVPGRDPKGA